MNILLNTSLAAGKKVVQLRKLVSLAVAAVIGLSLMMISQPASATITQCASTYMCFWHDQNYASTLKQYHNDYNDLRSDSDEFDSAYNRDNVAWLVYDNVNYGGAVRCIASGHRVANLGTYSFHDRISSIKKRTVAGCSGYTSIGS